MKHLRVNIEVPETYVGHIDPISLDVTMVLPSKVVDEARWGAGREYVYRDCKKIVSIPREYCEWVDV